MTIVAQLLPIAAFFAIYGSIIAALGNMFIGIPDADEAWIRNANIKEDPKEENGKSQTSTIRGLPFKLVPGYQFSMMTTFCLSEEHSRAV